MPAQVDLERLYNDHASALFAFLINLTRSEADTRDLLQDLFVKIARQPALLSGIREERAFLFRLVHNAAIDLIRRRETRGKYHQSAGADIDCVFVMSGQDEATFGAALSQALAEL